MLIDTHQHYWDPTRVAYDWMDPADRVIHRRYGPDDLEPHLERHRIDGTILVQSADSDDDTEAMFALGRDHRHVWGIVAYAPIDNAAATEDRLDELRTRSLFCGVRTLIHDRDDTDWILRPEVIDGLRVLAARAVPYDFIAVVPRHLEVLLELARRIPDLRIVLDHLGKPPFGSDTTHPWHRLIAEVAAVPGVHAKLSGLYPGLAGAPTDTDLRPWIDRALELFGPDRLMVGSDWPIAELAGGFDPVWSRLIDVVDGYGSDIARRLRAQTALAFYGVGPREEEGA